VSPVNASVRAFIFVPYAAPPVGALRWAPPPAPAAWSTPLATLYPPAGSPVLGVSCPQGLESLGIMALDPTDAGQSFIFSDGLVSEDCLYLNVWTPCADASCSLPVIVFLHGGAWVTGTSMDLSLDGTHFAEAGAVFVSLNYRLGALGFMASSAQPGASLNVGFQDQQAALRWVAANAAAFGGDPTRVMLTGQSAGSEAVSAHLLSPRSSGLFRRGLMESCALLFTPGPLPDYAKPLPARRARRRCRVPLGSRLRRRRGGEPHVRARRAMVHRRERAGEHALRLTGRHRGPSSCRPAAIRFCSPGRLPLLLF
jgi:para-nitrobenzyl esterase